MAMLPGLICQRNSESTLCLGYINSNSIIQTLTVLQEPTWMLRCWSPAQLGKTCLCIIGSLWTGDHRFISRFPSCSYMETSFLGRKLLSSSESAPCELYCYIIIILNSF